MRKYLKGISEQWDTISQVFSKCASQPDILSFVTISDIFVDGFMLIIKSDCKRLKKTLTKVFHNYTEVKATTWRYKEGGQACWITLKNNHKLLSHRALSIPQVLIKDVANQFGVSMELTQIDTT